MSSNVQNISKQDNSYSAEMNSKKISHKKQARRIKKQQELRFVLIAITTVFDYVISISIG